MSVDTLDAVVDVLLLSEATYPLQAAHGIPTTERDVRLALTDAGVAPSEELVAAVPALVEARRPAAA